MSDFLAQAVDDLDYYFNDPLWDDEYNAEFRERIIRMRKEAEYLSRNSLH